MTPSFLKASAAALLATAVLGAQSLPMQQYAINDPVLQMRAWTLTAPAGWNVQGTMLPAASCAPQQTSPVYKAVSPDGNTGVYFGPRADWSWGGNAGPSNDCLPFRRVVSAKDYLAYTRGIEHVGFVRSVQVPDLEQQRAALGPQFNGFYDVATEVDGYSVAGQPMEQYLTATITCVQAQMMGIGAVPECRAFVKRQFAPSGKLEAMKPTFDAVRMQANDAWFSAWQSAMVEHNTQLTQGQTQASLYQGAVAGQQRMKAHNDYMAATQAGYAEHNGQLPGHLYQKQNNKENYVDWILGCQRVRTSDNSNLGIGNCPNRETPP